MFKSCFACLVSRYVFILIYILDIMFKITIHFIFSLQSIIFLIKIINYRNVDREYIINSYAFNLGYRLYIQCTLRLVV